MQKQICKIKFSMLSRVAKLEKSKHTKITKKGLMQGEDMASIILNDAAQFGIEGAERRKLDEREDYRSLIQDTDRKIDEARFHYAYAYKRASSCLAR